MPYAGPEEEKFSGHCYVQDWAKLIIAANEYEKRLRLQGRNDAADMLLRAYGVFRDGLKLLAVKMAAWGTEELRKEEKSTRVRPDTMGDGGKRLEDYLVCEPIAVNMLPGTLGINDEEYLDNNVPWWITVEEGSTTRVGDRIFGLFFDAGWAGGTPPEPGLNQHPLFAPTPYDYGGGPGTIQNPIEARNFVVKAGPAIEAEWLARYQVLYAEFRDRLAIVAVTYR
jgi:hypothetical protein